MCAGGGGVKDGMRMRMNGASEGPGGGSGYDLQPSSGGTADGSPFVNID